MRITRKALSNLFFCCGLAAVVGMLLTFDVSLSELWTHLCRAGFWLIPIVGIWLVVYGFNAWSWRCVIAGNLTHESRDEREQIPGFWRLYRLTITGYALNYATPIGGLGGEPYRIMELSRVMTRQHATSSVLLYAMMHMFAHVWFWFTSVFLYLVLAAMGDLPLTTGILLVLGSIGVFCLLVIYLFSRGYKHGMVVRLMGWTGRIPGLGNISRRFAQKHQEAFRNIDVQIATLHQREKRSFYLSLLLEYCSRVVESLGVMFMLLLFGVDCGGGFDGLSLTFAHALLIHSFTSLFSNLLGFLPMQLGGQEGGFVLSITSLGLSAALGFFVGIISRVRQIFWILVGVLLIHIDSRK